MKVKLTYFKQSGKLYTSAEYESHLDQWHHVITEVRQMKANADLPGLVKGATEFIILVEPQQTIDGEDYVIPHLIM